MFDAVHISCNFQMQTFIHSGNFEAVGLKKYLDLDPGGVNF